MICTHLPAFFNANGDTTSTYSSRWHWRRTVQIKGPLFQVAIAIGNSFISLCTYVIRHIDYPYNELPLSWYLSITYPQGTLKVQETFFATNFAASTLLQKNDEHPPNKCLLFLIIYGSTSPQPMALMIGTRSWSLASVEDNSYGGAGPPWTESQRVPTPGPTQPPRNSQGPALDFHFWTIFGVNKGKESQRLWWLCDLPKISNFKRSGKLPPHFFWGKGFFCDRNIFRRFSQEPKVDFCSFVSGGFEIISDYQIHIWCYYWWRSFFSMGFGLTVFQWIVVGEVVFCFEHLFPRWRHYL